MDEKPCSTATPCPQESCPKAPGTAITINIPPGAVINLLNILEITSPSGVCLQVRIPLLSGGLDLGAIAQAITQAGGSIEFIQE